MSKAPGRLHEFAGGGPRWRAHVGHRHGQSRMDQGSTTGLLGRTQAEKDEAEARRAELQRELAAECLRQAAHVGTAKDVAELAEMVATGRYVPEPKGFVYHPPTSGGDGECR